MGDSKRRRALDPNYGKAPILVVPSPSNSLIRPLEHVENQRVLATGFLETWKDDGSEMAILLKWVQVQNYETGKPVTVRFDHCWLWVHKDFWKNLEKLNVITEHRFLLNEPVNFCAVVRRYTRRNGTQDLGLKLTNFFPVTLDQQDSLRRDYKKNLKGNKPWTIGALAAFLLTRQRIGLKIEDWRDISDRDLRTAKAILEETIDKASRQLYRHFGEEHVASQVALRLEKSKSQTDMHLSL